MVFLHLHTSMHTALLLIYYNFLLISNMDVQEPKEIALSEAYYRYIYTLPTEDQEPSRFMVHLQHAYWFFRDELLSKFDLPMLKLPAFVQRMQERFRFLQEYSVKELIDIYDAYRSRIPVKGAVLINSTLDKALCLYNLKNDKLLNQYP